MTDTEPDFAVLLSSGQTALQRGSFDDALAIFNTVLEALPENIPAAMGMGLALVMSGEEEAGITHLKALEKAHPSHYKIIDSLGIAHAASQNFEDAELNFRRALRLGGFQPASACNLGVVLNEQGRFDDATAMFKSCLRHNQDDVSARYHLGLNQLLAGNYDMGWEGFDLRNRVAGRNDPEIPGGIPRWTGEALSGRTIVVLAEQGLGDTIQFARYATNLADAGADVHIRCAEALRGIISTIKGVSGTIGPEDASPDADFQVPLLSLPRFFKTMPATIPSADGYIPVSPDARARWADYLGGKSGGRRIGLVWAGNPDNKTDRKRSIALGQMMPLLELSDATFFSLQVGPGATEISNIPSDLRPGVIFPEMRPFGDVAAAIASLDLVITVDTSIAHLAGAIGTPVWTLISHVPDWRWGLGKDDSGWYSSMRLFRQPLIGDWGAVVKDICQALVVT